MYALTVVEGIWFTSINQIVIYSLQIIMKGSYSVCVESIQSLATVLCMIIMKIELSLMYYAMSKGESFFRH